MLKVFNTLGRKLEDFKPINEGKVSFYHCGPTVYWTQHIGNMRGMVMGDLIRRSLVYLGYEVRLVRNYTDFGHLTSDADRGEDKIEKGAKREGTSPQKIADKYIEQFEKDTKALNIPDPTVKARATDYIDDMIRLVETLLEKGYAYSTPKAIYFDIGKFPTYTELSQRDLKKDKVGEGHGDVVDKDKKHPADFAIWFFKTGAHENALQSWPSPFESPEVENGEGTPGWHIECSAMAASNLGDTLDFHMGGVEHISIHHPNEIAQSEAASGKKFSNYWIHNEHLTVDGGKMAKSDGTSIVLDDIVEKGYDPMHLRYLFLQSQYRSKQNFTWEALDGARSAYEKLEKEARGFDKSKDSKLSDEGENLKQKFRQALEDDFNIPKALAVMWDVLKSDLNDGDKQILFSDFDQVLGLGLENIEEQEVDPEVKKLIEEREEARGKKDWKKSDEIRDLLKSKHLIEVEDTDKGTKWKAIK